MGTQKPQITPSCGMTRLGASDFSVVWLSGEHDASTVASVAATFAAAIAQEHREVVLDLSEVDFMGAATVGVIVQSRKALHRAGRTLTFRSPSVAATHTLDLCGLGHWLVPADARTPRMRMSMPIDAA